MRTLAAICLLGLLSVVPAYHSSLSDSAPILQVASDVSSKPALVVPPSSLKHRHAKFHVPCAACHGPDQSIAVPTQEACFQCHGSYAEVAELTKKSVPNPHHSHMGEVSCDQCHSEHGDSRLSCNQCHVFEMKVP
jgi:hypothetical protein